MTGQGHHEQTLASAPTSPINLPAGDRAPSERAPLRPAVRRVLYVGIYEALSVLCTLVVLSSVLGHGGGSSALTAVLLSTTATVWNYLWNTLFESMERRFEIRGRGPLVRVVHALGYEGGLLVFTVPMVALLLGVGFLEALMIESGMLVFFLLFTYAYSWAFDRVFGLPQSAR